MDFYTQGHPCRTTTVVGRTPGLDDPAGVFEFEAMGYVNIQLGYARGLGIQVEFRRLHAEDH
jgi:hypothetical protein